MSPESERTHWTSSFFRYIVPPSLCSPHSTIRPSASEDPETALKSLLTQTLTSLTTHLQTQLSTVESECASLRKRNEILEKEVIKMRHERDIARGRVMWSGRIGSVDGRTCKCGRSWEEERELSGDFEAEGEEPEGFTVLRHMKRTVLPKRSPHVKSDEGPEDMDLETDSDSDSDSEGP